MPEQFDRTVQVLIDRGLLGRCTRISVGDVTVELRPEQERAPQAKPEVRDPRHVLYDELTRAFPNAKIPPSLRGDQ